jgi:hypothetical protein
MTTEPRAVATGSKLNLAQHYSNVARLTAKTLTLLCELSVEPVATALGTVVISDRRLSTFGQLGS